jgi:hypothetical protein
MPVAGKDEMIGIKDKFECTTKAECRKYFEKAISDTPAFREKIPLEIMEINGEFSHYMHHDTDNMFIGFAIGMRCAERLVV